MIIFFVIFLWFHFTVPPIHVPEKLLTMIVIVLALCRADGDDGDDINGNGSQSLSLAWMGAVVAAAAAAAIILLSFPICYYSIFRDNHQQQQQQNYLHRANSLPPHAATLASIKMASAAASSVWPGLVWCGWMR